MIEPINDFVLQKIIDSININSFCDKSILVSGGSGFFGKWILQTFLFLNKTKNTNIKITSITRDKTKLPIFLIDDNIFWIEQDIINPININADFDYILHLATDTDKNRYDYARFIQEIITGTQNILDLSNENTKILLTSSGAVYGQMPDYPVTEDYQGKIDITNPNSFYGEGKRISEMLLLNHKIKKTGNIARCFAFYGEYISQKYAISSFIEKAKNNEDIIINSPNAVRSYMHASDLIIWLLVIIESNDSAIYNVGSDESVTMLELSEKIVKEYNSNSKIVVNHQNDGKELRNFYLPNTDLAKSIFKNL